MFRSYLYQCIMSLPQPDIYQLIHFPLPFLNFLNLAERPLSVSFPPASSRCSSSAFSSVFHNIHYSSFKKQKKIPSALMEVGTKLPEKGKELQKTVCSYFSSYVFKLYCVQWAQYIPWFTFIVQFLFFCFSQQCSQKYSELWRYHRSVLSPLREWESMLL